jgi:hypothetical protein
MILPIHSALLWRVYTYVITRGKVAMTVIQRIIIIHVMIIIQVVTVTQALTKMQGQ